MARLVLTAVGSAIGGPVGGFVGSILGGAIDNALFGPDDTREDAPGLKSLSVAVGAYGNPIPDGFGTHLRPGRLIWSDEKKENRDSETTSGGKDFGGPEHTTTTINPTVTCAYSLGWGPGRPVWIKANKQLLADFRPGANPVFAPGVKANIYDGTQTEASYLADSIFPEAPAYRGQIIVEFEDLPISQFGNDPPQVLEAMVIMDGANAPSITKISVDGSGTNSIKYQFYDSSTNYLWMTWDKGASVPRYTIVGVMDVSTRQWVYQNQFPYTDTGDFPGGIRKLVIPKFGGVVEYVMAVNTDNNIYLFDPDTVTLQSTHVRASGGALFTVANNLGLLSWEITAAVGSFMSLYSPSNDTDYEQDFSTPGYSAEKDGGICEYPETFLFFLKKDTDNTLALAEWFPEAAANGGSLGPINDQTQFDGGVDWAASGESVYASSVNKHYVPGVVSYTGGTEPVIFVVDSSRELEATIKLSDLGVTQTSWPSVSGLPLLRYDASADSIFWKNGSTLIEYSIASGVATQTGVLWPNQWAYLDQASATVFGGTEDLAEPGAGVVLTSLNSVASAKVPISTAIQALCERVGVDTVNIDVSGITDTMWGCPILVGSPVKNTIEQMLSKANGFGVLSEDKLKFSEFGGSTDRVFSIEQLASRVNTQERSDAVEEGIAQNIDIPAVMDLAYVSVNAEAEASVARSLYHFENRNRPIKREPIILLDSTEAAELVNRLHQGLLSRNTYEGIRLLPKNLDLEPGDIIEITEAGQDTRRIRITDQAIEPSLAMVLKGVSENPEDSTVISFAANDSQATTVTSSVSPTAIVMDSSLFRDIDNGSHPGPYVAVFRSGVTVGSTTIFGSATGDNYAPLSVVPGNSSVGIMQSTIINVESIDEWDETVYTVEIASGSAPSSLTDSEVLAGGNGCIVGRAGRWEIIQPATWTLVSGNTYTFTHTLRGRRGTDAFLATHANGDYLVVLDQSTIRRLELSATLIGSVYNVRAVSAGGSLASAATKTISIDGNAMKPYTVIDVLKSSGADHTWSWNARTRSGGTYGGANGLIDGVPGSQADGTNFEIDIFNISNTIQYATKTSTTEGFVYNEVDRIADGLLSGQHYLAKIYHMNGSIRGYEVAANSLGSSYYQVAEGLSPVAGYRLEDTSGTTAAEVIASRDGTYNGTFTLNQAAMISGTDRSALFGGAGNGNLEFPNSAISLMDGGDAYTIVFVTDINSYGGDNDILTLYKTTSQSVFIRISPPDIVFSARANGNTGMKSITYNTTDTTPVHYALVVDAANDTFRVYADGVLVGEQDPASWGISTITAFISAPTSPRYHAGFGNYQLNDNYNGRAQGVYFYDKALTAEEIGAMATYVFAS